MNKTETSPSLKEGTALSTNDSGLPLYAIQDGVASSIEEAGIIQLSQSSWTCFFPTRTGKVEFIDSAGNILLSFEPRPAEMRVCMNSCIGGAVGLQEWVYMPVNSSSYRVRIDLTMDGFEIICNNVLEKVFLHRFPPSGFCGTVKYTPGVGHFIAEPSKELCCSIL